MWILVKKGAKKDNLAQDVRETKKFMLPILKRELAKLNKAVPGGLPYPVSSLYMGIPLPGDRSDIDINLGVKGDLQEASLLLEQAGIPFIKMKGANRLHKYITPEGVNVDVGVRPEREVLFQIPGVERFRKLPNAQKLVLIRKKLEVYDNEPAYKQLKQQIYIDHGIIPSSGDWDQVDWKNIKLKPYRRR